LAREEDLSDDDTDPDEHHPNSADPLPYPKDDPLPFVSKKPKPTHHDKPTVAASDGMFKDLTTKQKVAMATVVFLLLLTIMLLALM
jgi:hypothetical protein